MAYAEQIAKSVSTYAADSSGVCSALFELGGMVVMHDASGCNSTYSTHDEPRWYDFDSYIFISGLTENEAIMGDDEKLISDVTDAAKQLSPSFIAVTGTPIPMMTGTDFAAVAKEIERRTGLPTFGFDTNGMNTYVSGVEMAYASLAERFTKYMRPREKTKKPSVNILGATPLDFSGADCYTQIHSMRKMLEENEIAVQSVWAMGDTLRNIMNSSAAWANLVVSYGGLKAAKIMQREYGIPYVVGRPIKGLNEAIVAALRQSFKDGENRIAYEKNTSADQKTLLIGEGVTSESLACVLGADAVIPTEFDKALLKSGTLARGEENLQNIAQNYDVLIADPLYAPIAQSCTNFIPLPHEGFSGRMFSAQSPDLVTEIPFKI